MKLLKNKKPLYDFFFMAQGQAVNLHVYISFNHYKNKEEAMVEGRGRQVKVENRYIHFKDSQME